MPLVTIPEDPVNAYFTDEKGMLVARINMNLLKALLNPPKKRPDPEHVVSEKVYRYLSGEM